MVPGDDSQNWLIAGYWTVMGVISTLLGLVWRSKPSRQEVAEIIAGAIAKALKDENDLMLLRFQAVPTRDEVNATIAKSFEHFLTVDATNDELRYARLDDKVVGVTDQLREIRKDLAEMRAMMSRSERERKDY